MLQSQESDPLIMCLSGGYSIGFQDLGLGLFECWVSGTYSEELNAGLLS